MGIEAASAAALSGLHRLSVHNHDAGTSRSPGRDSHLLVDSAVQFYPHACSFPSPEIMVDGTPSWELMRQQAPLTAGAQEIKDGVDDGSQVGCSRAATRACSG